MKRPCPRCRGTGEIKQFAPIDLMDEVQLADEIHKRALEKWKTDKKANEIVCLAFELKNRIKEGVAES